MGAMASQITSLTIVCSTVYLGADQRKYLSSASLAFVRGIHRYSCHKGPVTVTGEFPAQRASNAENVNIWWRHYGFVSISWFRYSYILDQTLLNGIKPNN